MMWPFLDPIECRQAEQYLAHGQPLEAARILLAAKASDHKSVREGLLRVGPVLIEQAKQALAVGDLLVAAEMLACAGKCVDLPTDARELGDQVTNQLHEQNQEQEWAQQRLAQADRWARDGRLYSALGMIGPLDDDPQAARRKLDWQQDVERLERYASEFREHLARAEFLAAAAVLYKARELAPDQPLVLCLEQELRVAIPPAATLPLPLVRQVPEVSNRPVTGSAPRAARLLISGLTTSGDVIVLPQSLITIGRPRDATVDLPIQALLRRRHCLLIREPLPGPNGKCHRLVPLAGASVRVNQRLLADGKAVLLAHDDLLQLGSDACRWRYRRPIADSQTAILQQSRPGGAVAVTPDGRPVTRVVLLADELTIGNQMGSNHLVEAEFPVQRLRLKLDEAGWRATVDGGVLFVDDGSDSESDNRPLLLPSELILYADGPALVVNALQGQGDYRKTLKLVSL